MERDEKVSSRVYCAGVKAVGIAPPHLVRNDKCGEFWNESTGNLDTQTGLEIIEILKRLNREDGVTIVCSTHDPKMLRNSQRVT